ncbi:MAG: YihY/virulence factor BrkB family protein [Chloroflexi bacterium]|nr:YihY/virulence factor BrkB family protein [Chloroflexota bacterium]
MERVLGVPRIGMAHAVYLRFGASSGPVLARGLAFVALFALVPALLVVVSIAGLLVRDEATRAEIVEIVAQQFPPLESLIEEALKGAGDLAATTGIIGIILLIWSASGLVRALDGAFRVVFEDDGEGRTPLRDVVAVASVAGGIFGAAIIVVLMTLPGPISEIVGVPSPELRAVVTLLVVTLLLALAYRFVPRPRPSWRMLALPSVTIGLGVWALTSLFAVLGPLLFGSAQLYGAFGALFLGLIWLSNVTQLIVLGAAWVAERDRRARAGVATSRPGEAPGI